MCLGLVEESITSDNKKIRNKQKDHEYYLKNKERILKQTGEYQKTHREWKNAYQNERNKSHREEHQKRGLDYYYAHKDEIKQKKQDNKEFYSTQSKKWRTNWRSKLFDTLGRKCVRCGYDEDIDCLQFDHINGDRNSDPKYYGGMHSFCRYYALNPEIARKKLQVLCVNCNIIKKHTEDRIIQTKNIILKQTKIAIRDRNRSIERWVKRKMQLMTILGQSECQFCGQDEFDLLQFDHINGGGKQERLELYASKFYKYYLHNHIEAKKKLQVLCAMCNWKKG